MTCRTRTTCTVWWFISIYSTICCIRSCWTVIWSSSWSCIIVIPTSIASCRIGACKSWIIITWRIIPCTYSTTCTIWWFISIYSTICCIWVGWTIIWSSSWSCIIIVSTGIISLRICTCKSWIIIIWWIISSSYCYTWWSIIICICSTIRITIKSTSWYMWGRSWWTWCSTTRRSRTNRMCTT